MKGILVIIKKCMIAAVKKPSRALGILVYLFMSVFPRDEKLIFFESFLGRNYSGSPKYIFQYLKGQNAPYRYVWSFTAKREGFEGAKTVKRFSFAWYYYLARAKYWVQNMRMPYFLPKPKGNVELSTWHGTTIKKLVHDIARDDEIMLSYKLECEKQMKNWDYLISANEYSTEVFRHCFKYQNEMLEYGYPCNDIFYAPEREAVARQVREKLKIPAGKKVILYAPTWRDDERTTPGQYSFTLPFDLKKLKAELSGEYVLLLRLHYYVVQQLDIGACEGFAFDVSSYDDIQELYLISDMLVTDYSSVFMDYANLRRPVLFYPYDLEKYRDELRGFYIDYYRDLPGPIYCDEASLIAGIKNIDEVKKQYRDKYSFFCRRFCSWESGSASANIAKHVFNV